MYVCYEDSVLDAADTSGNLTFNQAKRLLSDHGFTMDDLIEDAHDVCPVALESRNAQALLFWLGY
jgi:hypothetical protein